MYGADAAVNTNPEKRMTPKRVRGLLLMRYKVCLSSCMKGL